MTLTVGINTYCTLAEADTYFANTLKDCTWQGLTDTQKEICLKMACRKMEALHYTGRKQTETQKLEFPRYYRDIYSERYPEDFDGIYDGTPQDVKDAQAELALYLYQNQYNQVLNAQQMGLKSISLGNESYSFAEGGSTNIMCPETNEFLNKWIRKGFKVC